MKVAHLVIREAFSNKVITPGKTTNEDVVWWMRQRVVEMGLGKWFHPVDHDPSAGRRQARRDTSSSRGDMLHTDFGLVYLGFSTDTQHNAYVLKPGETDAPQGLKDGLKAAQPPAGSDDEVCARRQTGQPRACARRAARRSRRASCRRSTAIRSATTATAPGRRSA